MTATERIKTKKIPITSGNAKSRSRALLNLRIAAMEYEGQSLSEVTRALVEIGKMAHQNGPIDDNGKKTILRLIGPILEDAVQRVKNNRDEVRCTKQLLEKLD